MSKIPQLSEPAEEPESCKRPAQPVNKWSPQCLLDQIPDLLAWLSQCDLSSFSNSSPSTPTGILLCSQNSPLLHSPSQCFTHWKPFSFTDSDIRRKSPATTVVIRVLHRILRSLPLGTGKDLQLDVAIWLAVGRERTNADKHFPGREREEAQPQRRLARTPSPQPG